MLVLQIADVLRELNDLSDADIGRLIIIMLIAFITVSGIVAGSVTAVMTLILRRGGKREDTTNNVVEGLFELIGGVREDYRNAQTRFDTMRLESQKADTEIQTAITSVSTAIQDNSRHQADRAIEVVEKKIDGAAGSLQSSINLIGDQVQKMADVLTTLENKVDKHATSDDEMKTAINTVKGMAEETLSLIKARQLATDNMEPVIAENGASIDSIAKPPTKPMITVDNPPS